MKFYFKMASPELFCAKREKYIVDLETFSVFHYSFK